MESERLTSELGQAPSMVEPGLGCGTAISPRVRPAQLTKHCTECSVLLAFHWLPCGFYVTTLPGGCNLFTFLYKVLEFLFVPVFFIKRRGPQ